MQTKTLALILVIAGTALAQAPDVQFRAAQQKETVDGDLTAAIKLYQKVADSKATPPDLAARALVRLGQCYERLGSTEAAKVYERVVTQFGKEEAAAEARRRLASLPGKGVGNSPEAELVTRKVAGDLPWIGNTLTREGRYTLVKSGKGIEVLDLVTGSRKPIHGGSPLTSAGEFSGGAGIISADGQQFAFGVSAPGRGELRVAQIDGSGIRTLASLPDAVTIRPLDWSSDGRTILATPMSRESLDSTSNELLLVDVDGRKLRPVRVSQNVGGQARLSPDGHWIAFEGRRDYKDIHFDDLRRGDLFIIRTDGSGERALIQTEATASLACWAPDSGSVLFVSERLGADHLWAMPIKEGATASTPVSLMKAFSPTRVLGLTPQGALFYSSGSFGSRSFIARLNGLGGALSKPQPVKEQANDSTMSATWSPDGRYLCYRFNEPDRMNGAPPLSVVMVRDLVSGKEREVGRFNYVGRRISWTPDSKGLLVPARTGDGRKVLRLDLASGKLESLIPAALLDSESVAGYPQLSPDGKYLYYTQGPITGVGARLMRLDLAQGQAQQLAAIHQFYTLSPNGSELVAPVVDETKGSTILRVFGANGEARRDLVTLPAPERVDSAAWSPDGQTVYFGRTVGGDGTGLFRMPASGGNPVALGVINSGNLDLRIHPNGTEIAFVSMDFQMEVWRLEGLPQALTRALRDAREEGLVARKVFSDPQGTVSNTLTLDGRYTLAMAGFGIETLDLVTGRHAPVRGGSPLSSAGEVWLAIGNVISPDGRQIAFAISAPGRGELRVANIDGTGIRTLASIKGILKIQPLDWSADGRTVLAVPMDMKPGPEQFLLVDANGQRTRPVRITGLAGARAKLSPDGQWIAFEKARNEQGRYDRRGDLFIVRTDGSGERQLVRQASPVALAGWDTDGKSVLFASEQAGVDQLWAVRVKEGVAVGAPVSLMKGFSHSAFLGTTMQGALLYSTGSRVLQVLTAKLNGPDGAPSAPQPINASSHYMTVSPAWSPNGRFLCYQLMDPNIDKGTLPDSIVMVRDVSNGQDREIGRFPQISRRISWTSDSKSLVFPAVTTAGRNVLRVDVDSGKSEALIPAALTDPNSYYANPQMSPDGRYLYYMQAPVSGVGAGLMRLDLAQQQARQLATVHQFFALSPDGSEFLAPVADAKTIVLRVLGPNGETRQDLITIAEPDLLTSFAWSPDGKQVFFSKTTGGNQSSFFRIPASGGSPVSLGVQTDAFRDLSIHPNGGDLAFVGVASNLEIWRLEGLREVLRRAFETPRAQAAQALPTRAKQ